MQQKRISFPRYYIIHISSLLLHMKKKYEGMDTSAQVKQETWIQDMGYCATLNYRPRSWEIMYLVTSVRPSVRQSIISQSLSVQGFCLCVDRLLINFREHFIFKQICESAQYSIGSELSKTF